MTQDHTVNLECLKRCQRLTALSISSRSIVGAVKFTGFQHITGLTSLHSPNYRGCLAHLAPTLKQLETRYGSNVEDLQTLTNLEVLEVVEVISEDFFQQRGKLPLQHLSLNWTQTGSRLNNATAWQAAPKSLTRLTLYFARDFKPGVLPASIIHLQLMHLGAAVLAQAAAALPELQILDVCLYQSLKDGKDKFEDLGKFSALKSLGICIEYCQDADADANRHRQQVMSAFPKIAQAVANGVKLHVFADVNEFLGVFSSPESAKSEWVTRSTKKPDGDDAWFGTVHLSHEMAQPQLQCLEFHNTHHPQLCQACFQMYSLSFRSSEGTKSTLLSCDACLAIGMDCHQLTQDGSAYDQAAEPIDMETHVYG